MQDNTSGVEGASVAGEQELGEQDIDLFGDESTGEDDTAAAGQEDDATEEGGEQRSEGAGFDERTEQAFAKRLAAEREKLRKELEEELKGKTEAQEQRTAPSYGQQRPPTPDEITKAAEILADELMITPEAAKVMIQQQVAMNQLQGQIGAFQDRTAKAEAKMAIDAQRQINPNLPAFDEKKLDRVRQDYYQQYGAVLSWEDAYRQHVAQEAMSGALFQQVAQKTEQRTLAQVAGRDRANVQAGKGSTAKRQTDIWALPQDDFERLKERAKNGEFKRS